MRHAFHHALVVALLLFLAAPGSSAAPASGTERRSVVALDTRPGAGFLLEESATSASANDTLSVAPRAQLASPASLHYDEDHATLRRATRITLMAAVAVVGVAVVWGAVRLVQDMIQ